MLRVNWNVIKTALLLILVVFLFAFSAYKNKGRTVKDISVHFTSEENLFITHEAVNKLLIQNEDSVSTVPKDILDLNELELTLNSNPMIKAAQVYLTVNGEVRADVEQRKPIARVNTNASYYIDTDGLFMPLSENRSARVPLVTGNIVKNDLANVYRIARKVNTDDFLRKHVVEIIQHPDKGISLKMRALDFEIYVGQLDHLDLKINNLKAFYQKAKKDKTLLDYSKVNLQFDNQVVCTKK